MISKRIFLAALDCDTAGWYHARAAAEPPGPGLEWQFYTGNAIGELARNQLGAGRLLPFAPVEFACNPFVTVIMSTPDLPG